MTDVIGDTSPSAGGNTAPRKALQTGIELELIELLFFAYRDFVSEPDAVLADFGFGRAHHRVLHFVDRHPGMRVADLLDILRITKQSLARVLKQLIDSGFIEQRTGHTDRRERLLSTTDAGRALAGRLLEIQKRRVEAALAAMTVEAADDAAAFLRGIVDDAEGEKIDRLISAGRTSK